MNSQSKQFDKNWIAAKKRIIKVNGLRKLRFDAKYKEKQISIGDSVRLYCCAVGARAVLRVMAK